MPAEQIDSQAVVHAYRDEQLSLRQCANKFMASITSIRTILRDNNVAMRTGGNRGSRATIILGDPTANTVAPEPPLPEQGPTEREARAAGINDPQLLGKAAEFDRLIVQARRESAINDVQEPVRGRTAAQLARADQPGQPSDAAVGERKTYTPRRSDPTAAKARRA
ncbi:MAG: hypothetical protein ABSA93_20395 [Streptosporangiaceae bacterium]|jgi:hypothetical protein